MPNRYASFENNRSADPDDFTAVVQIGGSADGDALVQDIVDQGSTVGTPESWRSRPPSSWPASGGSKRANG